MQSLSLAASTRTAVGKSQMKHVRNENQIPAVIYGHGVPTVHVALPYPDFEKVYKQGGETTLIDVAIDAATPVKALIHDVQIDAVSRRILHVDFHQVRMDEKIHASIKLNFLGTAPAVKELGGVFVTNFHEVQVECLPGDLVESIDVDVSSLVTYDNVIKVSDIKIPSGMRVLSHAEDVIALVQAPRSEAELESLVAKPELVLPEGAAETPAAEGAADEKAERGEKKEAKKE